MIISKQIDELSLDILCEMRPYVTREVFRSFMAGSNGPYLRVDPEEFRSIARYVLAREFDPF